MEIHMCKYEDTTAQVTLTMELLSTQWSQYSKWQKIQNQKLTHVQVADLQIFKYIVVFDGQVFGFTVILM